MEGNVVGVVQTIQRLQLVINNSAAHHIRR